MVRLRFQRLGRRNRPFYRLAAMDARTRREGPVIERLGWYDPMAVDGAQQVDLKPERIRHWLDKGAQPSGTVRDLLAKNGILNEKEMAQWEKDRETDRNRVTARLSVERAQKAVEALAAMASDAEADLSSFEKQARDALKAAQSAKASGKVPEAEQAAASAEAAVEAAKKADEQAKAEKAAAEAKAAEEAAAAAPAEGEGGEDKPEGDA